MATSTMDLFAGLAARDRGMTQAAESRNELVNQLRKHLENVAHSRDPRLVTADDYEPFLLAIGKTSRDLGNAAGVIFKTDAWEFTGLWTPSKRKTNKARYIRVWRLK